MPGPGFTPHAANFAWWKQLRNVDCSWICNREESERFLYYDGPTTLRCPVQFAWEDGCLVVRQNPPLPKQATPLFASEPQMRLALLLQVTGKRVEAEWVSIPVTSSPFVYKWPVLPEGKKIQGRADEAFLKRSIEFGLKPSEAAGMLECWRKPFFENDGVRLLMFLDSQAYERVCPLTMKPAPTELARVGIIWAELK